MSQPCSRRAFLSAALAAPVASALAADVWKTWRTGNPDDTLVSSPNGTIEFRTKDAAGTNPEIVRRLVAAGADVIAVDEVDRTLQEAYVDIVRSARDAG